MRRWWLVFMAAVVTFVATLPVFAQTYITLDSTLTPTGSLYLRYGHLLEPPYIFETDSTVSDIYVRVDQDPAFNGTGVVRLPLAPSDPPSPNRLISRAALAAVPSDPTTLAARSTVDSLALVTYYEVLKRTGSPEHAINDAVRVYEEYPNLVDSIRVVATTSYIRYWKNCPIPFVMSFPVPDTRPVDPMNVARTYVQEKVKELNAGRVLLIGPGGMLCDPGVSPTVFAAGLDSLRRGQNALRVIDKARWRDELRLPKPAADIVRLSKGLE